MPTVALIRPHEMFVRLPLCSPDRAADKRPFCLMHGDDQFCDSPLGLLGRRVSDIDVVERSVGQHCKPSLTKQFTSLRACYERWEFHGKSTASDKVGSFAAPTKKMVDPTLAIEEPGRRD